MNDSGSADGNKLVVASLGISSDLQPVIKIHAHVVTRPKAMLLQKVIAVIATRQRAFIQFGIEWLWADTGSAIATAVGVNSATISRMPSAWSIDTPHGIIPIRAFMDSGVLMLRGSRRISRVAIEASLRRMLINEDADNPYSDDELVSHLADMGIGIARRTVAKYRAAAGIAGARERRRDRLKPAAADLERFQRKSSPKKRSTRIHLSTEEQAQVEARQQIEGLLRWAALPGIEIPDERSGTTRVSSSGRPALPALEITGKASDSAPVSSKSPDPVRSSLVVRALRQIVASLPMPDNVTDRDLARLLRYRGLEVPNNEVQRLRRQLAAERQEATQTW
jgi:hypothetical protein